jgi:site-specific DNA-methyltransferase (adenine-specific)
MRPYYDEGGITIYHGDSREITVSGDVIVTDPPYGISHKTDSNRSVLAKSNLWPRVHGDDEPFDPRPILDAGLPTVLWGANHYASRLPDSPTWLVWYKRMVGVTNDFSDCELAWTNLGGPVRLYHHAWMGMLRDSEKGESYHPTQKPLALMRWVLEMCPPGVVVDPYMGSGSTLVAAKAAGRRAIGIEIEERYCETAVRRLAQESLWGAA